jgi:hypothetical protein
VPTFLVASRSSAGLAAGIDRSMSYFTPAPGAGFSTQRFEGFKFSKNADESVICGCAGGMPSMAVARDIALNAKPATSETAWQKQLEDIAMAAPGPQPWPFDEILVIRPDDLSGVWVVTRYEERTNAQGNQPKLTVSVVKSQSHICIGDPSPARLLPAILWKPDLSVDRLEVLAHLTLSYASQLNPSAVGFGFDILTIRPGQRVSWKQFPVDGFEQQFTDKLRAAFEELQS